MEVNMKIEQKTKIAKEIVDSLKSYKLTLGEAQQIASSVASKIFKKIIDMGNKLPHRTL